MRGAISWACETRISLGIVTARSQEVRTVMLASKQDITYFKKEATLSF
jgi:hypothetical protein